MSKPEITVPIATCETNQATITPPWFVVKEDECSLTKATYKPLVNGEEAFAAVYHAIANAQKTVDIICWGFQPSMFFLRDGQAPCIGELLRTLVREKQVQVRILGWEMPLNAAGAGGEANLPGKPGIKPRAGQSATDEQHEYDKRWFLEHTWYDLKVLPGNSAVWPNTAANTMSKTTQAWPNPQASGMSPNTQFGPNPAPKENNLKGIMGERWPLFVGRGFGTLNRAEIAYRASFKAFDKDLSLSTIGGLAGAPSHHQKTVLVDFELPESAVGFVMGHNMLDEYWDTDAHTAERRPGAGSLEYRENVFGFLREPNKGPTGFLPRQDISSQVTGPILVGLHKNFATAWQKETGEDLLTARKADEVAKRLEPRPEYGTELPAQLVRTQPQEGMREIEALYLNAVNNATQFIYIENQYFRWPALAEAIKTTAAAQTAGGKQGAIHLFVTTNVTDGGIGAGTVNTQRMMASLGRADMIPEVTKLGKIKKTPVPDIDIDFSNPPDKAAMDKYQQEVKEYEAKIEEIKNTPIMQGPTPPGLKMHICSLVAPDSPGNSWMPVYIHSKLMIIDDVFTTHGSANINTRSMQVDSEMNIAHDSHLVTKAMRQRLWKLHTNGLGTQDDPADAFGAWDTLLKDNKRLQNQGYSPKASIIEFLYPSATWADLD